MTQSTRYGIHYDEVRGVIVMSKHGEEWTPNDYELEITETEASEHVHLSEWNTRRSRRFSSRDQSFPQLMGLMVRAEEEGTVRI